MMTNKEFIEELERKLDSVPHIRGINLKSYAETIAEINHFDLYERADIKFKEFGWDAAGDEMLKIYFDENCKVEIYKHYNSGTFSFRD